MKNTLALSVVLCAALGLTACSYPSKSQPSGEWLEVNAPFPSYPSSGGADVQ